jgi:hypothetical protein
MHSDAEALCKPDRLRQQKCGDKTYMQHRKSHKCMYVLAGAVATRCRSADSDDGRSVHAA